MMRIRNRGSTAFTNAESQVIDGANNNAHAKKATKDDGVMAGAKIEKA